MRDLIEDAGEPGHGLDPVPVLPARVKECAVIALPDSARMDRFSRARWGQLFTVSEAADGRGPRAADLLEQFDRDLCLARTSRTPSGPEMGCALGHARVLIAFAQGSGADDDLILVAEDDALISNDLGIVLERIITRTPGLEYAILADPFGEAGRTPLFGHSRNSVSLPWTAKRFRAPSGVVYRWGEGVGDHYGTGLYVATRRAARKVNSLILESGKVHWIADDYAYWARAAGIDIDFVRPNLAGWHGESTIQRDSAHTLDSRRTQAAFIPRLKEDGRSLARHLKRGGRATGQALARGLRGLFR